MDVDTCENYQTLGVEQRLRQLNINIYEGWVLRMVTRRLNQNNNNNKKQTNKGFKWKSSQRKANTTVNAAIHIQMLKYQLLNE